MSDVSCLLLIFYCSILINVSISLQHARLFARIRPIKPLRLTSRTSPDIDIDPNIYLNLLNGKWVKFICGASNQDLPLIKQFATLYTLAGVDCIDMSADIAVINAVSEGIDIALRSNINDNYDETTYKDMGRLTKPYMMISINDDIDPHFRKASFDPTKCPADCQRPCEKVCPALAIPPVPSFGTFTNLGMEGVDMSKCYGCGRCIPVCPRGLISDIPYLSNKTEIQFLLKSTRVDAIEIHTRGGHEEAFKSLWATLGDDILTTCKVISISFPSNMSQSLKKLCDIMSSSSKWSVFKGVIVWQADGRPMSGDIGKGTVHTGIDLAFNILSHPSLEFGHGKHFLQLAGGTNNYSSKVAKSRGLTNLPGFGGIVRFIIITFSKFILIFIHWSWINFTTFVQDMVLADTRGNKSAQFWCKRTRLKISLFLITLA